MSRKIVLSDYNPEWAALFEQEKARLEQLWGSRVVRVHHIGSTAIGNICAKPTIDLLVEVKDVHALDPLEELMSDNGYLPRGENGIAGRRYYVHGTPDKHLAHIHAFNAGHPEVTRHIRFVQYMRAHPDEAQAYAKLKQQLAQEYPYDSTAYTDGKSAFIHEIDDKALDWVQERL